MLWISDHIMFFCLQVSVTNKSNNGSDFHPQPPALPTYEEAVAGTFTLIFSSTCMNACCNLSIELILWHSQIFTACKICINIMCSNFFLHWKVKALVIVEHILVMGRHSQNSAGMIKISEGYLSARYRKVVFVGIDLLWLIWDEVM